MIFNEDKFGYDPDSYDDEPSDYVNSDTAYNTDELEHNNNDAGDNLNDIVKDDPISDSAVNFPSSNNPAAFHSEGKKPVYIKDMPYIDHATPGVTSN